jgi:hypothetical protein
MGVIACRETRKGRQSGVVPCLGRFVLVFRPSARVATSSEGGCAGGDARGVNT